MRLRKVEGAKELINAHPTYILNNENNKRVDIQSIFPITQPVHIEIGMGKGKFIYTMAKENPSINFIGVERFDSVIVRALEKMIENPLQNLFLIRMDANDLTDIFDDNSFSAIYLNFSDPWPKERHQKRRLTNRRFLEIYQRLLIQGKSLHFKTDNKPLFDYSVEEMKSYGMNFEYITYDLHKENDPSNIMTEFEAKYSKLGNKINKVIATFKEKRMDKLYRELVDLPGAPGFEHQVRNYMKKNLEPYVDEVIQDRLGSIFGIINKGSKGPKVMLAGHMDEVAGVVTGIKKNGLVQMTNLGGMKGEVFLSQHFDIYTDSNGTIPGVTISKPPHLTRGQEVTLKPLKFSELLIDIGANDKEHAEALGVQIGQQVIPHNNYTVSKDGKKIFSKAWDNRFGCGIALEAARDLSKEDLDAEFYVGATVQEEVGLRGAGTAANMVKPDVFIAVDCSPCADIFDGDDVSGKVGEGFLLRFYDPSAIMHQGMKKFIIEEAEKNNIKFQYYKSMGGTDAAKVQLANEGVLVATIGMPTRYIHSTTSMINVDDYHEVKKMVYTVIRMLTNEKVSEIKQNV